MKLAIAEKFHSIQGEGRWTGTPMFFIRTAGCSVGKLPELAPGAEEPFPVLKTGKDAWFCHTYDGRGFWCDTDFNKKQEIEIGELLNEVTERHVCITGGEPLIHREAVDDLISLAVSRKIKIHIETSGTINWPCPLGVWVTVSPKAGVLDSMLNLCDEVKLLVDGEFDESKIPFLEALCYKEVYLQPINSETALDMENVRYVLQALGRHPEWKLSIQLHKILGLR